MKKRWMTIFSLLSSTNTFADVEFEKLWKSIEQNSLALKASDETIKAAEKNLQRSKQHWLPTIYANGQSYLTDDPGANLFGLLSQRKIQQSDFVPDKLNEPGSNVFTKGTIGLNFPLYEGGMKTSLANVSSHQFEARKYELKANQVELYSEVAKSYFNIQSLELYQDEIKKIKNTLDSIIGRYQVGSKSNPIGYSGLLGLKNLKNRLTVLDNEALTESKAFLNVLEELNGGQIQLNKKKETNYLVEMNRYLSTDSEYKRSFNVEALEEVAEAAKAAIGAENSRSRPRIGLFAESYAFNGERGTGAGYTTGVYLSWNIFSGTDHGADQEAMHNSYAAHFYYKAKSQQEKIEFDSLKEKEATIEQTIDILSESQKLLDEQIVVANNLFKSGMINALQLSEVLSRRVDLLKSKNEVEANLIETKAKKYEFDSK